MSREKLEELADACEKLIVGMQAGNHEAIDAARGLLWRWVDEGNATELTNLLAAIRFLSLQILKDMENEP